MITEENIWYWVNRIIEGPPTEREIAIVRAIANELDQVRNELRRLGRNVHRGQMK